MPSEGPYKFAIAEYPSPSERMINGRERVYKHDTSIPTISILNAELHCETSCLGSSTKITYENTYPMDKKIRD